MQISFTFGEGVTAVLKAHGERGSLTLSSSPFPTRLADELNRPNNITVTGIFRLDDGKTRISFRHDCKLAPLVDYILSTITELYDSDVTISIDRK